MQPHVDVCIKCQMEGKLLTLGLYIFWYVIACMLLHRRPTSVANPEFHNGRRTVKGKGSGEGAVPPPQKKIEFLPQHGGFWCILGLLFTVMQKLVRSMGGAPRPPLDPPLAYIGMQNSDSSLQNS